MRPCRAHTESHGAHTESLLSSLLMEALRVTRYQFLHQSLTTAPKAGWLCFITFVLQRSNMAHSFSQMISPFLTMPSEFLPLCLRLAVPSAWKRRPHGLDIHIAPSLFPSGLCSNTAFPEWPSLTTCPIPIPSSQDSSVPWYCFIFLCSAYDHLTSQICLSSLSPMKNISSLRAGILSNFFIKCVSNSHNSA